MSTTTTTRVNDRTATLYLAFELGNGKWRLGFTPGFGRKPRERTMRHAMEMRFFARSLGRRSDSAWPRMAA